MKVLYYDPALNNLPAHRGRPPASGRGQGQFRLKQKVPDRMALRMSRGSASRQSMMQDRMGTRVRRNGDRWSGGDAGIGRSRRIDRSDRRPLDKLHDEVV